MSWLATWWGNIDWAATGTWMQAWAGFAGAGAVLCAAKIGAAKFGDWLRQQQTGRRIHTAERTLEMAYKVRRAFEAVRSPGYDPMGEGRAALTKLHSNIIDFDDLPEDQQSRLTWSQIILTRLVESSPTWEAMLDMMPLAKAHFGDEIDAALNKLWTQRAVIYVAARQYGGPHVTLEQRQKFEDRMWEAGGDDSVGAAVKEAIEELEFELLPVLRSEVVASANPSGKAAAAK